MQGEARLEAYGNARGALEQISREMTPAVTDTRMQYVIMDSKAIRDIDPNGEAGKAAPNSQSPLWMAPLGKDGELHVVSYYLHRDAAAGIYRLKRLYIEPFSADPDKADREVRNPYYPQMHVIKGNGSGRGLSDSHSSQGGFTSSKLIKTAAGHAEWFTKHWDGDAFDETSALNQDEVVSTVADNVVAFWVQAYDLLGNPVPWMSESNRPPNWTAYEKHMQYNSAAYMTMATTEPLTSGGDTTLYLAEFQQALKANRVPAAVKIALVTVDKTVIARGYTIPEQQPLNAAIKTNNALDIEAAVHQYQADLNAEGIHGARTFSIEVKILNGA